MDLTTRKRRLETQGFTLDESALTQIGRWLRFTPAMCATLIGIATAMASPLMLWMLSALALAGAIFPRHPFDLVYNHGIRLLTRTSVLPVNPAPRRFSCAMASLGLAGTAITFGIGETTPGYVFGGAMTAMAIVVSVTDICVPSMLFQYLFARAERDVQLT